MSRYARISLMRDPGHLTAPVIIFDGDDTLWGTMHLYANAKNRLFDYLSSRGCNPDQTMEFFEQEDLSNVAAMGFGLDRFETSMRNTIARFCTISRAEDGRSVDELISSIRAEIATGITPVASDAYEVLSDLSKYYRLILLTKGDLEIQQHRVASSGLEHLFDQIVIVSEKQRETFLGILTDARVSPSESWSIGNSLRSDVLPAIEIGMKAIWLEKPTWAWEDVPSRPGEPLIRANSLLDVRKILIPERK
jgi:putative hydrolase of the HAD superfamily